MDFAGALNLVSTFVEKNGGRCAVAGGIAMAAHGVARSTLDLDVIVDSNLQDRLVAFLETEGYRTLYRSRGYSNHLHAEPARGRVDVIYVSGSTADRIFREAVRRAGPGGRSVLVPAPEHLAAMKVFAIKNDPQRRLSDLADIQSLLRMPGVNREVVRREFERHGMDEEWRDVNRSP